MKIIETSAAGANKTLLKGLSTSEVGLGTCNLKAAEGATYTAEWTDVNDVSFS